MGDRRSRADRRRLGDRRLAGPEPGRPGRSRPLLDNRLAKPVPRRLEAARPRGKTRPSRTPLGHCDASEIPEAERPRPVHWSRKSKAKRVTFGCSCGASGLARVSPDPPLIFVRKRATHDDHGSGCWLSVGVRELPVCRPSEVLVVGGAGCCSAPRRAARRCHRCCRRRRASTRSPSAPSRRCSRCSARCSRFSTSPARSRRWASTAAGSGPAFGTRLLSPNLGETRLKSWFARTQQVPFHLGIRDPSARSSSQAGGHLLVWRAVHDHLERWIRA